MPFFSKNLISDFYFVGTNKQLLNLCSVVLEYGNKPLMNPNLNSVHYIIPASIFLKQNEKQKELQYIMCLKSLLPEINRFGYEINNCKESISINHCIYDHFESLPADVLYSSSWRGEQIVPSKIHSFEYHKIKGKKEQKKLNALNMFIFLSPKKYFTLGIPKTWKVSTCLFLLLTLYIFKPLLTIFFDQKDFNLIETNNWVDYGHIDKYFEHKKIVESRSFNSLNLNLSKKVIRKTSSLTSKFYDEVYWAVNFPNELKKYINSLTLHEMFV